MTDLAVHDGADDRDADAPSHILQSNDLLGRHAVGLGVDGHKDFLPFSYEPGTTGGEKKHAISSGSGPSDSVA